MTSNSTILIEKMAKTDLGIVDLLNTYNGFAIVVLTFIMLIIHIVFIMQNRRARKASEKPEVVIYIHPSKNDIHTIIDFTIINCGSSPAYDIKLSSNTPKDLLEKAGICEIGYDTLCNIPVIPKDESITAFFGQSTQFMNQNNIEDVSYTVSYKSSDGDLYKSTQIIPIKYFGRMETVGNSPIRDIAESTKEISSQLTALSSAVKG